MSTRNAVTHTRTDTRFTTSNQTQHGQRKFPYPLVSTTCSHPQTHVHSDRTVTLKCTAQKKKTYLFAKGRLRKPSEALGNVDQAAGGKADRIAKNTC